MPGVTDPLPDLVLYGRPGCHLCADAHAILVELLAHRRAQGRPAPELVERNIEDDAVLHRRFVFTIPVVAYGSQELELATSPAKVGRFLAQALDGGGRTP
jgi:hypothetical protein